MRRELKPNGEAGPSFASLNYAKNVLVPRAFHWCKNNQHGKDWNVSWHPVENPLSCGTLRIIRQLLLADPARLASYCVS